MPYGGSIVSESENEVTISFYVPDWESGLRVVRSGDAIPLEPTPTPLPSAIDAVYSPDEILSEFHAHPGRAAQRFVNGGPVIVEGVVNSIYDTPPDNPHEAAVLEPFASPPDPSPKPTAARRMCSPSICRTRPGKYETLTAPTTRLPRLLGALP